MESETLQLLGNFDGESVTPANFKLSASCNRTPVIDGHTEAVFIEMGEEFEVDDVKDAFKGFKGLPQKLGLHSAPESPVIVREEEDRPQPRMDHLELEEEWQSLSEGYAGTVCSQRTLNTFWLVTTP